MLQIIISVLYKEMVQSISRLEKKAKIGWACYFKERELHLENIQVLHEKIVKFKEEIEKTRTTKENEVFPIFVQNEIRELYSLVNKELECPICLDTIKKEELVFSPCGHKFCDDCYKKIDNCAVCRKKIWRKS
jgi:hypothetical protein